MSFYAPANDVFAWLKDGKPTTQALAVISAVEHADQEGLNPDDYDGPRWKDRVAKLTGQNPPNEDQLARFDLALTVSLVRYVSEERLGRVKPEHLDLRSNGERNQFDAAQFIREQIVNSNDVAAALLQLEPPYVLYRHTEEAMRHYIQLAAQDDGEKLPPPAGKKKTIEPGDDYPGVPRLIRLLKLVGDLPSDAAIAPDSTVYQGPLVDAMKRFQDRHGLQPDGRIGKDTLDQLNTPLSDRVQQLQLTMERWRWVPRVILPPPILVNIPEFVVRGFGPQESIELTMRVVVGKSFRTHTPVFAQDMSYVIFRPYWNVPIAIQRAEIVPKLKKDPDYLVKNQMEVVDSHGTVVTDTTVTPEQLAKLNTGALNVRQKPGPKNSLGLAKFVFPNEHNVYLHSTPSQELFSRTRRDFSHGCIRVEFPDKLAEWILKDNGGDWTLDKIHDAMQKGKDSQQVNLKQKRPVFIVYATAVVLPDGTVKFFQDIYGHDGRLKKALAQGFPRPHRFAPTSAGPAPRQRAQS